MRFSTAKWYNSTPMMRSEGQRLLRERVDDGVQQKEIAERVKRAEPTVSLWLSGSKRPDAQSRFRLQDQFGIDARAWDWKPNGKKKH